MERRDFIILSAGALLLGPRAFAGLNSPPAQMTETLYSGYRIGDDPYASSDAGFSIASGQRVKRFKVANEIHSVAYSRKHDVKIFLPKLDLEAVAVFPDGRQVKFYPAAGHYFYGHGVVDETRDLLYVTQAKIVANREEVSRLSEPGAVHVYTLPDLKLVRSFRSFGNDPHDLKIFGKELVVCNGGTDSSIAFIDLETQRLVRSFRVGVAHLSLRHIDRLDEQNFVIATLTLDVNESCPLYLLNVNHGLRKFEVPPGLEMVLMRGQLLSLQIYQNKILATCPATNSLLAWNHQGKFLGGQKIRGASSLAVCPSLRGVLVGSGDEKIPLHLLQFSNNAMVVKPLDWGHGITGSHSAVI